MLLRYLKWLSVFGLTVLVMGCATKQIQPTTTGFNAETFPSRNVCPCCE